MSTIAAVGDVSGALSALGLSDAEVTTHLEKSLGFSLFETTDPIHMPSPQLKSYFEYALKAYDKICTLTLSKISDSGSSCIETVPEPYEPGQSLNTQSDAISSENKANVLQHWATVIVLASALVAISKIILALVQRLKRSPITSPVVAQKRFSSSQRD